MRVRRIVIKAILVCMSLAAAVCSLRCIPQEKPASGQSPTSYGMVEVLGLWGGKELDDFTAMTEPWEKQTDGSVVFTGTRDLIAILTMRITSGNPPDVAILPNPSQMIDLARSGKLVALNSFLNMDEIRAQYTDAWIGLGSYEGKLYGVFVKAVNKGTVWYSPSIFTANGWQVPATWDEMITLSDRIVAEGKVPKNPWSIAVESGQASGWPATDWMAEIMINKYGADVYDRWVDHRMLWTDPIVKDVWQMFGKIALTQGYVAGGANAILSTNFVDGTHLPFEKPPRAAMDYIGDFAQGFVSAQFPTIVAGSDYSFFPFPSINPEYKGALTGGADLIIMFRDSPSVRSLVEYLTSSAAQEIWVKRGGFTSVNKRVNMDSYPNYLSRQTARQLTEASLFRFSAGDIMPAQVQKAWWDGTLSYLQDPSRLDSILSGLEAQARQAYR